MDAEFEVRNDKNKLVIDANFHNLWLSRKVLITQTGTFNGAFSGGEILAAVGGVTGDIDAYCENNNNGYTCIVNTYVAGLYIYIFSQEPKAAASGCGLQVFDNNGKCVFDSNNKYAKVAAFGTAPNTYKIPTTDHKYAIAVGCPTIKKEEYVEEKGTTESWPVYVSETVDYSNYDPKTGKFGTIPAHRATDWYANQTITTTDYTYKSNYKIVGDTVSSNVYYKHSETSSKSGSRFGPYREDYYLSSYNAASMASMQAQQLTVPRSLSHRSSYVDTQTFLLLDVTGL